MNGSTIALPGNWQNGITAVVAFIALFFVIVLAMDIKYHLQRKRSVADRIQRWSFRYPYWSVLLIALYAAIMAHFFINAP